MKPELLEPLLVDRALGELTPAVAALLDAHLAHDPAAARRAAEFDATLHLARAAVALPRATPPPALDLARLRRAQHATRATSRRTEILRLAGCLALGLTGGWLFRNARPVPTPPVLVAVATPRTAERANHFWSLRHFAPEEAALLDAAISSPEKNR